jgi:uncharacterized membrane protein YcaP (DUF421 family)
MEPFAIVVRVIFAYCWVLLMLRITGRRAIGQSDAASFVVALVIGDMFDDLFWGEVSAAQFVVGVGVLAVAHLWNTIARFGAGSRDWHRRIARSAR